MPAVVGRRLAVAAVQLRQAVLQFLACVAVLSAIPWGVAGGPPPRHDKPISSVWRGGHAWYWSFGAQELAISPDGKWIAACLVEFSSPFRSNQWRAVWVLHLPSGRARLINAGGLLDSGAECVA